MDYPEEILPQPRFKQITCDLSDFHLIRTFPLSKFNEIEDQGSVPVKAVCDPSSNINDLSTILFGVFSENHITIELTPEGKKIYSGYCNPNEAVEPPTFETQFIIDEDKSCWHLQIDKIKNANCAYVKNNESFNAKCVIEHTSAKWNYWHLSIRWEIENLGFWHEQDEKEIKKIAQKLSHTARIEISKNAKIGLPPQFNLINQQEYLA